MNTNTIFYFITYFFMYSFLGWVLESVYKTIYEKRLVNSGFLIGPYCPIYGFGAIIMYLMLNSLKDKPILLFIAAFFVMSFWEYIVGLFLEKVFKTKYWDYSDMKFNIQGRVCLKNSIYWALLGTGFIYILHPFFQEQIIKIPTDLLLYIDIIIGIAMAVDLIANIISTINFESMIVKINELGETIKQKAKELVDTNEKLKKNKKTENIENVENIETIENIVNAEHTKNVEGVIQKLKREQAILKIRIYKQASRLKKAFPTMKSETITNFLNQKIDLKKLKQIIKREKQ